MKRYPFAIVASLIFLTLALVACGPGEPEVTIDNFGLLYSGSTIGYTGDVDVNVKGSIPETGELSIIINDSGTPYETVDIEGSFSETFMVIFMEPGVYTLKSRVTIGTATWDSEETITITVEDTKVDVDNLAINLENNENNEIIAGGAAKEITLEFNLYMLGSEFNAEKPTNQRVVWTSSNEAVATVNDEGLVSGESVGTAVITATSTEIPESGDPKSDSITINVVDSLTDDAQDITVNTSDAAKNITGVGNSAVEVRFTLTQDELDTLFGENSGPYAISISHTDTGLSMVKWACDKLNVPQTDLKAYPEKHSYVFEPGTYIIDLSAPLSTDVTVPLRVWVREQ
jgi:hypothetical protein